MMKHISDKMFVIYNAVVVEISHGSKLLTSDLHEVTKRLVSYS